MVNVHICFNFVLRVLWKWTIGWGIWLQEDSKRFFEIIQCDMFKMTSLYFCSQVYDCKFLYKVTIVWKCEAQTCVLLGPVLDPPLLLTCWWSWFGFCRGTNSSGQELLMRSPIICIHEC
jgi:hypothetical protein